MDLSCQDVKYKWFKYKIWNIIFIIKDFLNLILNLSSIIFIHWNRL